MRLRMHGGGGGKDVCSFEGGIPAFFLSFSFSFFFFFDSCHFSPLVIAAWALERRVPSFCLFSNMYIYQACVGSFFIIICIERTAVLLSGVMKREILLLL